MVALQKKDIYQTLKKGKKCNNCTSITLLFFEVRQEKLPKISVPD